MRKERTEHDTKHPNGGKEDDRAVSLEKSRNQEQKGRAREITNLRNKKEGKGGGEGSFGRTKNVSS